MRGLYAIVDPEHCAGRDPRWVAAQILKGGCVALQLRAKHIPDGEHLALARALLAQCRAAHVPFWMNDRPDLALLTEADGLHLGQDDLPPHEARKLWGTRPLGLSTHSLAQARAAVSAGVDLIGFGPVFQTRSKHNPDPEVGLAGAREVCAAIALPVVAIGGIQLANIAALKRAGVQCCAVISALCAANDPAQAARDLSAALAG